MNDAIVSAAVQTLAVLILCLAVWAVFGRRRSGFRAYVGLTAAPPLVVLAAAAFGVISALLLLQVDAIHQLASGENSIVGAAVRRLPPHEVAAALVVSAVIKTGFAEELLFRGLIGKRLIAAMGFWIGNTAQALLFGAVYLLLLLVPDAPLPVVLFMVAFAGASGWINGWLNEQLGRGSILPGWAAHASGNTVSYLALAGLMPMLG